MSTLSVIIPTFNRKDFLLEALESVQAQTRPVDEIIVWDDGSTDGTQDVMAGFDDPKLQYHRAENAGKSAALNQAMKLASGCYIWICDDDDLAVPDAAEELTRVLDNDPTIGISGGSYQRFRDTQNGRELSGPGYWPDLDNGTPLRHLLEDIYLFQNATIVRRSCYDEVGPFREDLARSIDYEMLVRLATRYPIHMSQDVMFLQRKHDGDRGPASMRHAASAVDNVWAAQDRIVFDSLRDHIPLSLIQAMYEGEDPEVKRAAHIERACIFARHDLWDYALDDLAAAAQIAPATPLGPTEFDICRRAVSGKHGVHLTAKHKHRITQLKRSGTIGKHITRSLGRGLLWSVRQAIRQGDLTEVIRLGRILFRTGIQMEPQQGGSKVRERGALPLNAFKW